MDRAYSVLTITKADAAARVVEGLCSSPRVDLAGDIVEPRGGKWQLPVPFLHQHDHASPCGWVEALTAGADGLRFRARLAKIAEPGKLRDRLELVWDEIRTGLLKGVSIGFSATKVEPIATGVRFVEWTLHEISAVTIPCNQDASIQAIKAADRAALAKAATCRVVRLSDSLPGARKQLPVVRLNDPSSPVASSPVASAIRAIAAKHAEAERLANNKKLGASAVLIDMLAAGTLATDAELAALRARLDRLERGK